PPEDVGKLRAVRIIVEGLKREEERLLCVELILHAFEDLVDLNAVKPQGSSLYERFRLLPILIRENFCIDHRGNVLSESEDDILSNPIRSKPALRDVKFFHDGIAFIERDELPFKGYRDALGNLKRLFGDEIWRRIFRKNVSILIDALTVNIRCRNKNE